MTCYFHGRMERWKSGNHRFDIHLRSASGRCWSMRATMPCRGKRSARSARRSAARARGCAKGCGKPKATEGCVAARRRRSTNGSRRWSGKSESCAKRTGPRSIGGGRPIVRTVLSRCASGLSPMCRLRELPSASAGHRQAGEGRPCRHRPQTPHRAERHAGDWHGLLQRTDRLITVADKPGAVQFYWP